jgi:hypothetical protein
MCDTQNEHRLLGGRRDTRARKKEKIEKRKKEREREERKFLRAETCPFLRYTQQTEAEREK